MSFPRRDIDTAGAVAVHPPEGARAGRKRPISYYSVEIIAILVDAAIIVSASVIGGMIYHYQVFGTSGDLIKYLGAAALVAALFISLMQSRRLYRPNELLVLRSQIRTLCLFWVAVFS